MTDARRSPNAPMCQRLKNLSLHMRLFTSGFLFLIIIHKNTYVGSLNLVLMIFIKHIFAPARKPAFNLLLLIVLIHRAWTRLIWTLELRRGRGKRKWRQYKKGLEKPCNRRDRVCLREFRKSETCGRRSLTKKIKDVVQSNVRCSLYTGVV